MGKQRLTDAIAPAFYPLHGAVKRHDYTHYTLLGGRGSTKSSCVSIEVLLLIKRHPSVHAAVFRKVAATMRDSVFAQYTWAIDKLGLTDEFTAHTSPMEIIYKPTGQKILFRGLDDWSKIKSIKVPFGYIGVTHFEELDQFAGRDEIRRTLQSTMRGGKLYWNFESYNPPATQANWVNQDAVKQRDDRLIHQSCYLDVPREWLEEQFFLEAEELKRINEKTYRHEYLGEITGTGGQVFEHIVPRTVTDDEIRGFERVYHGVDFGWYPDPWAYVQCAYSPAARRLVIFDEATAYKANNRETADILKAKGAPLQRQDGEGLLVCDSAEPKSVADYAAYGLKVIGAEKPAGSVVYSHKWLQGLSEIVIDPARCPATWKEFSEYEYERTKTGEVISGYPDKDNHLIDATRYALNLMWRRRGR